MAGASWMAGACWTVGWKAGDGKIFDPLLPVKTHAS